MDPFDGTEYGRPDHRCVLGRLTALLVNCSLDLLSATSERVWITRFLIMAVVIGSVTWVLGDFGAGCASRYSKT